MEVIKYAFVFRHTKVPIDASAIGSCGCHCSFIR
jgi:hypothetical protein